MASWSPCVSMSGRFASRSRSTRASTSGRGTSPTSGHRISTTSAPTHSSGARVVRIRQMDGGAHVPHRAIAGGGRAVARELQGIPDPAEARELQPRRGDAETFAEAVARQEQRGVLSGLAPMGASFQRRASSDSRTALPDSRGTHRCPCLCGLSLWTYYVACSESRVGRNIAWPCQCVDLAFWAA